MAREDHQPWPESPERPERTPDEMRKVCGRTIAFILALDKNVDGSNPDIDWALTQAKRARVAAAIVLAAPALVDVAIDATRSAGRKGNTLVQALEYDPSAAIPLTREAGDFELFGLPYGLLMTARAVSEGLHDDYDAVLIMDAAQDRIASDHLYELCLDAREHPEAEVVESWIQWLRRMPCLIKRAFLDRLAARDPLLTKAGKTHQVPFVQARDHVFGEEQLAAPKALPGATAEFLDGCTMSALQAIQLAKYAADHPGEELHSPNQKLSLMGHITLGLPP